MFAVYYEEIVSLRKAAYRISDIFDRGQGSQRNNMAVSLLVLSYIYYILCGLNFILLSDNFYVDFEVNSNETLCNYYLAC